MFIGNFVISLNAFIQTVGDLNDYGLLWKTNAYMEKQPLPVSVTCCSSKQVVVHSAMGGGRKERSTSSRS